MIGLKSSATIHNIFGLSGNIGWDRLESSRYLQLNKAASNVEKIVNLRSILIIFNNLWVFDKGVNITWFQN